MDNARLIVKVLRDVVAAERFTTIADAVDCLKFKLARLRIAWTPDTISEAVAWVMGDGRRQSHVVQPLRKTFRRTRSVVVPVNRPPASHADGQKAQTAYQA